MSADLIREAREYAGAMVSTGGSRLADMILDLADALDEARLLLTPGGTGASGEWKARRIAWLRSLGQSGIADRLQREDDEVRAALAHGEIAS